MSSLPQAWSAEAYEIYCSTGSSTARHRISPPLCAVMDIDVPQLSQATFESDAPHNNILSANLRSLTLRIEELHRIKNHEHSGLMLLAHLPRVQTCSKEQRS